MVQNELTHWGVKGQKWGVRRFRNKDGSLTSAGKKRARARNASEDAHDDYKKAHDPKNVKTMSDKELRERLNRLQMEKQYSQLSNTDVNKGKQYIDKAIKMGATVAAVTTTALTVYNNIGKIKTILESSPAKKLMNIGLKEPPIRA